MISNTRQNWIVGHTVKVGFMTVKVREVTPNLEAGQPDAYIMSNLAGTQLYRFTPHFGLVKIDTAEVREMIAFKARVVAARAANIVTTAAKVAEINAIFA